MAEKAKIEIYWINCVRVGSKSEAKDSINPKKVKCGRPIDRPTDRHIDKPTDQWFDEAWCRVA